MPQERQRGDPPSAIQWDCYEKPRTPRSSYSIIGGVDFRSGVNAFRQTARASAVNKEMQKRVMVKRHMAGGKAFLGYADLEGPGSNISIPPQRLEQKGKKEIFNVSEQKAELMKSTVFDGAANSGFNNFVRINRTISTPVARNPDIGYEEDGDLFGLGLNHKRDASQNAKKNKGRAQQTSVVVDGGEDMLKGKRKPGHNNPVVRRRRKDGKQFPLKPGQVGRGGLSADRGGISLLEPVQRVPKFSANDFNNASARSHTEMKQNKGMQSNSSITFLHDPTFSPYTNHQRAKPVYGRYGRVSHFMYH